MGGRAARLAHLLHSIIADGAAVDLEALVVRKGRTAWTLFLDLTVLDHDGGLDDACALAAMAALSACRLPQTELCTDGTVIVHNAADREPLPLTIQHVPLAATFSLLGSADDVVLDATRVEAAAAAGSVTVVRDRFAASTGEICAVHKSDGLGTSPTQLLRCAPDLVCNLLLHIFFTKVASAIDCLVA